MKVGDRVTGVPDAPRMRERLPTVTGFYDETYVERLKYTKVSVLVGRVHISCTDISPAHRRTPETREEEVVS